MVDPKWLLSPHLEQNVLALMAARIDPRDYEVSSETVRKVVRESRANRRLRRYVLRGLEPILRNETVDEWSLAQTILALAERTNDEEIIAISNDLKNLDKLPIVKVKGKPVSEEPIEATTAFSGVRNARSE